LIEVVVVHLAMGRWKWRWAEKRRGVKSSIAKLLQSAKINDSRKVSAERRRSRLLGGVSLKFYIMLAMKMEHKKILSLQIDDAVCLNSVH